MSESRKIVFANLDNTKRPQNRLSFAETGGAQFWSEELNCGLKANQVCTTSARYAKFRCPYGHVFTKQIRTMSKKAVCSVCRQAQTKWTHTRLYSICNIAQSKFFDSPCYRWKQSNPKTVWVDNTFLKPHMASMYLKTGERIKYGQHTRHLCEHGDCCNAFHLTYGTPEENMKDKIIHGTQPYGENHYKSKLSDADRKFIKESHLPINELVRMFNISKNSIYAYKAGRRGGPAVHGKVVHETYSARQAKRRKTSLETQLTCDQVKRAYVKDMQDSRAAPSVPNDSRFVLLKPCALRKYVGPDRYGVTSIGYHREQSIRVSYAATYHDGDLSALEGKVVRHLCRERACIEPTHLQEGTQSENQIDSVLGSTSMAKLNKEHVKVIYENKSNLTATELARNHGVSVGTILNIFSGKCWSFITKTLTCGSKKSALSKQMVCDIFENVENRTAEQLASKFNVSVQTVFHIHDHTTWHDVTSVLTSTFPLNRRPSLRNSQAIEIYTNPDGLTVEELCSKFGVLRPVIINVITGRSFRNITDGLTKGEHDMQKRKLSEQDVVDIYLNPCKHSDMEFMTKFNICLGTIRSIRAGKRWKSVTDTLTKSS